jgi:hypothetical protein
MNKYSQVDVVRRLILGPSRAGAEFTTIRWNIAGSSLCIPFALCNIKNVDRVHWRLIGQRFSKDSKLCAAHRSLCAISIWELYSSEVD